MKQADGKGETESCILGIEARLQDCTKDRAGAGLVEARMGDGLSLRYRWWWREPHMGKTNDSGESCRDLMFFSACASRADAMESSAWPSPGLSGCCLKTG